jgi:hypothetical protein
MIAGRLEISIKTKKRLPDAHQDVIVAGRYQRWVWTNCTAIKQYMKLNILLALTAMLALFTGCETSYQGPPVVHRHPPAPAPHGARPPEPWVDVSITTAERQVIQGYTTATVIETKHPRKGKKPKNLPPGLQKKLDRGGSLPPGWENKFRRGEILPVEVYQQCHPLPREVMVQLPPQPPGTILISIGGKVARLLSATREILDVFEVEY